MTSYPLHDPHGPVPIPRRCWATGCDRPGSVPDLETPPIFTNPDDPDGPTVRPVHCDEHHRAIQRRRDDAEASWHRMVGGRW